MSFSTICSWESDFFDRGLYYLCRMVSQQGRKGKDWYYEIYPVYGIYFLNFQLPKLGKLRTDVILADRETGEQVSGKLRQIYLSLPYFTLGVDECETNFDRWIYMLKNMDRIDLSPFDTRQRVIFDKLLDVANVENLTPRERRQYEENLKNYRDYNGTIATALRTGREEGMAEGIEKGMEKGWEAGIAEGKRLLASGMKKEGFAIESIHRLTGLSPEEINKL